MNRDLQIIRQIEQELGVKLTQVDEIKWDTRGYVLNKNKEVTGLGLFDCKIKDLKRIISPLKELKSLTKLALRKNQISDISPLKELKSLTKLALSFNIISDISPLKELTSLTELDLRYNQISDISPLKELTSLIELDLGINQISDISPLEELTSLTELYLGDNQISDISPLKELTSLTGLHLGNNQISDISPLKELKNLTELHLGNNQISDISPLKELKNLTELNLWENQISDISPLKELTSLTKLDLQDNPIKELPEWIIEFNTEIEWGIVTWIDGAIYFYKNPLVRPPVDIVKQGKEAIKRWFEQQKKYGEEKFYEAKILIVGEGAVGKTSLLKKLKNDAFVPEKGKGEETHGINIDTSLHFPNVKNPGHTIHTSIWDFGGQHIQYFLHHYFLSEDALYILVSDKRKANENFEYWFRAINHFGGKKPQVVVLYNEKDKNYTDFVLELDRFKRSYPDFDIDTAIVDLKLQDESWREFKKMLNKRLADLETVGTDGIKAWNDVKDKLLSSDKNYISLDEFNSIATKKAGMDEEDIPFMLEYFHKTGFVLHFGKSNDRSLRQNVFLKPGWLIEALYAPIAERKDISNNEKAIIPEKWLEKYWDEKDYTKKERDLFISLLQENRFDVAFRLDSPDDDKFMVPQLLPNDSPKFDWQAVTGNGTRLRLDFDDFLPDGLITRFIVRANKFIKKQNGDLLVGNKGVILEDENVISLVEADPKNNQIVIRLKNDTIGDFRGHILGIFKSIYDELPAKPEILIPCNCSICKNSEQPYLYKYSSLKKRKENEKLTVECDVSYENVNVDELLSGIRFTEYNPNKNEENNQINKPLTIKIFLGSADDLSDERIIFADWLRNIEKDLGEKVNLKAEKWEYEKHTVNKDGTFQERFNKLAESCDVGIFLFWKKLRFTKEEFERAFKSNKTEVLVYFRELLAKDADFKTRREMLDFQESLSKNGLPFLTYSDLNELENEIKSQLMKIIN